jgi:rubrerythrin
MKFDSIEEILDFAIAKEEEAERFYSELAESMDRPGMREAFLKFASEEAGHRQRLLNIKAGDLPSVSSEKIQSLGIADHLTEVEPSANMTYQEALQLAMNAEKAAFRMYTGLAAITDNEGWAEVFRSLAQEEAKHKLRFEIEYDDVILEGV